ncbi:MAG: ATPase involved in chromosome partitioning [Actinomycetia bacterium]|nr:ATPase involved in chromosome partitioning [Actinomycetes bacterium]
MGPEQPERRGLFRRWGGAEQPPAGQGTAVHVDDAPEAAEPAGDDISEDNIVEDNISVEVSEDEPSVTPDPPVEAPAEEPLAGPKARTTSSFAPNSTGDDGPEHPLRDIPRPAGGFSPLRAAGPDAPPEAAMTLPRVLAIANQKGGVGKTTTAVNLGAGLAELGYRVLVIDLDPQGNATTGLGISHRNVQGSIYDVIMNDTPVEDCVEPTSVRNLFVVPATIDLAGAEIELVPAFSRELKLRRALGEVRNDYDFTLIDCPPSLGLLTVNGLAASDDIIVPIQCEYYALEGLGQLLRNVSLVRSNLNPTLDVRGIVLTMYDARTRLAEQVEHEVRTHFGSKVYRTVVPRTVRISEAPSFGQPITVFDSSSRGAVAYRELAKEVSRGTSRRAG